VVISAFWHTGFSLQANPFSVRLSVKTPFIPAEVPVMKKDQLNVGPFFTISCPAKRGGVC
ncbi:MAG: hypothetical protein K2P25_03745, partial [Lachnospiraceae bacterium]|nr:hypothetical protein [Lachnospiraceae bacterium]